GTPTPLKAYGSRNLGVTGLRKAGGESRKLPGASRRSNPSFRGEGKAMSPRSGDGIRANPGPEYQRAGAAKRWLKWSGAVVPRVVWRRARTGDGRVPKIPIALTLVPLSRGGSRNERRADWRAEVRRQRVCAHVRALSPSEGGCRAVRQVNL